MTQRIPAPVVDVIATYCKTDTSNIKTIIEASLRHCIKDPDKYASVFMRIVESDFDHVLLDCFLDAVTHYRVMSATIGQPPNMLVPMGQAIQQHNQTKPPSASPHAPTKRKGPKPSYWMKTITSIDDAHPNGFGLKGKFITPDMVKNEPIDTLIVLQTRDNGAPILNLLKVKAGAFSIVRDPIKQSDILVHGAESMGTYHNYDDLFSVLFTNHNIPKRVARSNMLVHKKTMTSTTSNVVGPF